MARWTDVRQRPDGGAAVGGILRARILGACVIVLISAGAAVRATPAAAQSSILVRVLEAETAVALVGAEVSLLSERGETVAAALTDSDGRHLFGRVTPGRYRVQAEMIGRRTYSVSADVGEGERADVVLALPIDPIRVDSLVVEGDRQCRLHGDTGPLVARLWDEARKALANAELASSGRSYRFRIRAYERVLSLDDGRVEREEARVLVRAAANPIRSAPAEELAAEGYIRPTSGPEYDYFAPDAAVLLSSTFLETHCFQLASEENDSLVGLAFEPASADDRADIRGTFWLDPNSGDLRLVSFSFTRVPWGVRHDRIGGEVRIGALPGGERVVEHWFLRMPLMERTLSREGRGGGERLARFLEVGQEVLSVRAAGGRLLFSSTAGTVAGTVFDSTAMRPLEGATVFLRGTEHSGRTDEDGRFSIAGIAPGAFEVGFTHPRLDSLGLGVPSLDAGVARGAIATVSLAVPSRNSLRAAACPERHTGTGVVLGTVRDEDSGVPLPLVDVSLSGVEGSGTSLRARTDGAGWFVFCSVPSGAAVAATASVGSLRSADVTVDVPSDSWVLAELELSMGGGAVGPGRESGDRSRQVMRGRVVDGAGDVPLASSRVIVKSATGDVVSESLTGEDGRFAVRLPQPGAYSVQVEALGHESRPAQAVSVEEGEVVDVEIRLGVEALELEPLLVTVDRRDLALDRRGFFERMESGLGTFFTPQRIERLRPGRLTHVFRGVPGAVLSEDGFGRSVVYFRGMERAGGGGSVAPCWPRVILNGIVAAPGGLGQPAELDALVDASEVRAMEVYARPSQVPARFGGSQSACGVVVIWTK